MAINKRRIDITLSDDIVNWLSSNVSSGNRSPFIEDALRNKIKKSMTPEQRLQSQIAYHERMIKEHADIRDELCNQLALKKGEVKLIDSKILEKLNHKAEALDKLESYQKDQLDSISSMPIFSAVPGDLKQLIENPIKLISDKK